MFLFIPVGSRDGGEFLFDVGLDAVESEGGRLEEAGLQLELAREVQVSEKRKVEKMRVNVKGI